MLSPFRKPRLHSPSSLTLRGTSYLPTLSCLTSLSILLCWGIKPPQDQMPPHWCLIRQSSATYVYSCILMYYIYICMYTHVHSLRALGFWLFDIVVLPMGLQSPSAPSVLSYLSLGSPDSVQWLAVSAFVLVRCLQSLSEDSPTGFLSAICSWH